MSVPPSANSSGAPVLAAPARPAAPGLESVLRWISIFSLDAPLVAVAWLVALGRPTGWEAGALGLAVWWGYAVDRWLDGWKLPSLVGAAARHRFAAEHRAAWGALLFAVLVAAFAWIPAQLPARLVWAGSALAASLVLYTALDQLWPRALRARAQRELWVALAVATSVVLFAGWGSAGSADFPRAGALAFALFALCAADCRAIRLLETARAVRAGLGGSRGPLVLSGLSAFAFAASGALPEALAALGFGAFLGTAFERHARVAEAGGLSGGWDAVQRETIAPRCDLALAAAGLGAVLVAALVERAPLLAG